MADIFSQENIDTMVQKYMKKVWKGGVVVSACVAIAAARAIIHTQDRSQLVELGGHRHGLIPYFVL